MNKLLFSNQNDCKTEPAINGQGFKFSNAFSTTDIAVNEKVSITMRPIYLMIRPASKLSGTIIYFHQKYMLVKLFHPSLVRKLVA